LALQTLDLAANDYPVGILANLESPAAERLGEITQALVVERAKER
jgi:hypothetical protein